METKLPGINVGLDWVPDGASMYPICVDPDADWRQPATTLRELWMLRFMNEVTDKPNWTNKVVFDKIANKYKDEAIKNVDAPFSETMANFAIQELRHKANLYKEIEMISVYDPGVMKSDSIVSNEIKEKLQKAVKPLEDVKDKDWHPSSNGKVLDLVHPSLFPLVYDHSKVLRDSTVDLKDPLASTGLGVIAPEPDPISFVAEYGDNAVSYKFQWLPCEVEIDEGKKARISSYINNLHPHKHQELYGIIEDVISAVIPLWSETLKALSFAPQRVWYEEEAHDIPEDLLPRRGPLDDETDWYEREYEEMRVLKRKYFRYPEPDIDRFKFQPFKPSLIYENYGKNGLQVIVKLANIHLTPLNPTYEGGSWHFEGQLNERICSTAIYYYDCSNVTESRLYFRQGVDHEEFQEGNDYGEGKAPREEGYRYEQDEFDFLELVYGLDNHGPLLQDIGSVLCKEGRVITFPNVLQHRVEPFELADKTKPGYRKILALFLVDPNMKIVSTAHVPPQRKDWWEEKLWEEGSLGEMPLELHRQIVKEVDDLPFDMEKAKEWRLELMEERSAFVSEQEAGLKSESYNLCEH